MSFRTDVIVWVAKVGQRLEYVGKSSAYSIFEEVRVPLQSGGNMPVRTGNLRNSVTASTSGFAPASYIPKTGERLTDPADQVKSVINSSKLGDKIFLAFGVAYAVYVNRKYAFIELTALNWGEIVRTKVAEAIKLYR